MIRRGHHERIDGLVVERAPEIGDGLHRFALGLAHGGGGFGQHRSVHVAHTGDLGVGRLGERFRQHCPAAVQTHHADHDLLAR